MKSPGRLSYVRVSPEKMAESVSLDKTEIFTYDNGGNIISSKTYVYTTGTPTGEAVTKNYGYDSAWKDKLVSYGNLSIIYYFDGNGIRTKAYVYCNSRGDVTALYSESGALLATYSYDAWGNCTIKDANGNTIAEN